MNAMDSRTSRATHVKPLVRFLGSVLYGQPVYCASCHKPDGWVTVDLPPGVIYICDACSALYGQPDEFIPRPDLDRERIVT